MKRGFKSRPHSSLRIYSHFTDGETKTWVKMDGFKVRASIPCG